jgi:hypothetical protein
VSPCLRVANLQKIFFFLLLLLLLCTALRSKRGGVLECPHRIEIFAIQPPSNILPSGQQKRQLELELELGRGVTRLVTLTYINYLYAPQQLKAVKDE